MNQSQVNVLKCVNTAKKATYSQAVSDGGNGKTVEALVKKGLLAVNEPTKKVKEKTYSLSAEGKAALKAQLKLVKA